MDVANKMGEYKGTDAFNDVESIITSIHEKSIRFTDPMQIFHYYRRYESFANHIIIDIAQKLLNFMIQLAELDENRQWKLFLKEKYRKRWQYFRHDITESDDDYLDAEDHDMEGLDDMLDVPPEDLVIFHF